MEPAEFFAKHVYTPAFSCDTESTSKVLTFRLFNTETPFSFVMVLLLCNQIISTGKSPLTTVQVTEAGSPLSTVSSPKSKGKI